MIGEAITYWPVTKKPISQGKGCQGGSTSPQDAIKQRFGGGVAPVSDIYCFGDKRGNMLTEGETGICLEDTAPKKNLLE